jgi:chromosomal replication initiation ATPase DnaA
MRISVQMVIRYVCRVFFVSRNELLSSSRLMRFVEARRAAIILLREDAGHSFSEIALALKRSDHTTALVAYRQALIDLQKNTDFSELVGKVRTYCQAEASHQFQKAADRPGELEKIRAVRRSFEGGCSFSASSATILAAIRRTLGVSEKNITGRSHKPALMRARYIAFFLLRRDGSGDEKRSFPAIGKIVNRHPTTVMYGYDAILQASKVDPTIGMDIERIRAHYAVISGSGKKKVGHAPAL